MQKPSAFKRQFTVMTVAFLLTQWCLLFNCDVIFNIFVTKKITSPTSRKNGLVMWLWTIFQNNYCIKSQSKFSNTMLSQSLDFSRYEVRFAVLK